MPKFLFHASLNAEGVAGVLAEGGTARREVVKNAVESVGGTLEPGLLLGGFFGCVRKSKPSL